MAEFLLEIGLEEIPARMIAGAEAELGRKVTDLLTRERLLGADGQVTTYSTPRRLAVLVTGLAIAQADTTEEMVGPSWKIAFPNGEPGPAAQAFAKKAGVDVASLVKVTNAKGEYVGASVERTGRAAADVLAADLPREVLSLYWAKNMYWRAAKPERFVRPLRWLVALLDSAVIPLEIAGIAAGNTSRGHRILHGESSVTVATPSSYLGALRAAFVDADVAARRHTIRKALDHVTRAIAETPGARWREDEALVETVVHLTEWPTVLYGSFEAEYLTLPEEVLVTVMRDHQKYFAVEDAQGKLAPHFLTVLNTQVDAEGQAIIRHGNERVLRSRFKDAQFFWETDQKTKLTERQDALMFVTFQKQLGSYYEKVRRIQEVWYPLIHEPENRDQSAPVITGVDENALKDAVSICKSDLTCELVKEFTELQGVIGGLYAKEQGHGEIVAAAIYDQYKPVSTEGEIPRSVEGCLLAISDKLDTIAGMFALQLIPTGSKDPFALRRAGNGIIKILAEWSVGQKRGLRFLSRRAITPYGSEITYWAAKKENGSEKVSNFLSDTERVKIPVDQVNLTSQIEEFLAERLSFYLKDVRNFAYDVVTAVLAAGSDDVRDAIARAEALTAVRGSADFIAISAASKRIKNILRQASEKGEHPGALAESALTQPEERALLTASTELAAKVATLRQERNYTAALEAIATLRPTVDAFFESVMVMAPEPELRAARLALIQSVLDGFSGIADFSEIVVV